MLRGLLGHSVESHSNGEGRLPKFIPPQCGLKYFTARSPPTFAYSASGARRTHRWNVPFDHTIEDSILSCNGRFCGKQTLFLFSFFEGIKKCPPKAEVLLLSHVLVEVRMRIL